jgi:hypothetical protein
MRWGSELPSPPHTYTRDKWACLPRSDPEACHPSPFPVYLCLHMFYSRGSGCRPQPLPCEAGSLGCVFWVLSMDSLSYGSHSHCAQGPASLCMNVPTCFPSFLCGGRVRAWVWHPQFFFFLNTFTLLMPCNWFKVSLDWEAWQTSWNNLSHKVPCYKFFMGGRVPVSPGRRRKTEINDMWWDHGGSRKCVLTS